MKSPEYPTDKTAIQLARDYGIPDIFRLVDDNQWEARYGYVWETRNHNVVVRLHRAHRAEEPEAIFWRCECTVDDKHTASSTNYSRTFRGALDAVAEAMAEAVRVWGVGLSRVLSISQGPPELRHTWEVLLQNLPPTAEQILGAVTKDPEP
jgi:hypothetical protein